MRFLESGRGFKMGKKKINVPDEQTKWAIRGHASKHEYIGWLRFNDLVDESFGYDDTYLDPYSGKTLHLGDEGKSPQ